MSFFEIFQPGLALLRQERDRQKMLVSKPTYGGGAPLGIDLDGGVAKIRIKAKPPVEPEVEPQAERADGSAAADPEPAAEPAGPDQD